MHSLFHQNIFYMYYLFWSATGPEVVHVGSVPDCDGTWGLCTWEHKVFSQLDHQEVTPKMLKLSQKNLHLHKHLYLMQCI